MKKAILFLLFLVCYSGYSQNTLQSLDDLGRISFTPVLADDVNIPSYASALVKNKLMQIVTQNGLGSTSVEQRFIITANIVEISREIASTAPPMVAIRLAITLYIGDVVTGNLFSSCQLPTTSGVGTNETKAYLASIRTMNVDRPEVNAFVEKGRTRIIEYYNSQIDFIISRAMSLADKEQFDDAMCVLFAVPEVCKSAYCRAMDAVACIYQRKIDKEGMVLLNTATQVWNANQSYGGADMAASYLSKIHPLSSSFNDACKLSENIAARIKEIDAREWNFRMKRYDDERSLAIKASDNAHEEKMLMINAAKEICVAKAKQPITYNYNRITWW